MSTALNILDIALAQATLAHTGQHRRDGALYITHPIAVAAMMTSDWDKSVALLHDVLETTTTTVEDLCTAGIPMSLLMDVELLTKLPGMSYDEYIARVCMSPSCTRVKLADMFHNISDQPTTHQRTKYLSTVQVILAHLQ